MRFNIFATIACLTFQCSCDLSELFKIVVVWKGKISLYYPKLLIFFCWLIYFDHRLS